MQTSSATNQDVAIALIVPVPPKTTFPNN